MVLIVTLLAGGLFCDRRSTAEEGAWQALFRGSAEVNVINIDVFVSDAQGRPVTGLTKEDFELFENGRPIEISNFYAVDAGLPPAPTPSPLEDLSVNPKAVSAPAREIRLAFFIDTANIAASHRRRLMRRLRELLLAERRTDLQVMLMSRDSAAGRPLVVRQGFTSVVHEIFVSLEEIEATAAGSGRLDLERRNLMRAIESLNVELGANLGDIKGDPGDFAPSAAGVSDEARRLLPRIEAYSEQRYFETQESLDALQRAVDILGALPGRKALIYVGDGLAMRPGEALFEIFANRVAALGGIDAELSSRLDPARYETSREVLDLAEKANTGRVIFYAFSARAPAFSRRGGADSGNTFRTAGMASFEEDTHRASLILLAEQTGGRTAFSTPALDAAMAGILTDFDYVYSLGYTPEEAATESRGKAERAIDVRVRGGYRVRFRRSLRDKTAAEEMSERVLAALVPGLLDGANPLGISPDAATKEDRKTLSGPVGQQIAVPVRVRIPLGKLVLEPSKAAHEARLAMYVAVRDEDGRTSGVAHHLCPIRIPNSEMLVALGRDTICGVRLLMRPGPQRIAVGIRDELSGTSSIVRFELDVAEEADDEAVGGMR